jgi:two-component system response regulator HydG
MKNLSFSGLPRVLVLDDDVAVAETLRTLLQQEGVLVDVATDLADARARLAAAPCDVVFADVQLPDAGGAALAARLRTGDQPPEVVLLAGYGSAPFAVEAMRHGACDVIERPFAADRVLAVLGRVLDGRQRRQELAWLRARVRGLTSTELIGLSPALREVQARAEQVAATPDAPVLVVGEAGAGKELVARTIHERSARHLGPFVAVNCAAMTPALLEAELFGYEAGAYAGGARHGKDGLFALAAGGTLLLDEVSAIDPSLQVKLLRVIQERTFRRVGGVVDLPADVRIVAASRQDLRPLLADGRFREDLFFRLDVTNVRVPPLRERAADVPLLAHFFLDQIGRQMGKAFAGFSEEAMETLVEHAWPGNVRELRNVVEHACIVSPGGMLEEQHLPKFTGGLPDGSDEIDRSAVVLTGADRSIRALEERLVASVLDDTQWNISRAASILGINRTTLYNKIRLYGLGKRPQRTKVDV